MLLPKGNFEVKKLLAYVGLEHIIRTEQHDMCKA